MDLPHDIYSVGRRATLERFAQRLEGSPSGLVLAVFTEPLDARARDALQKSFAALGYGSAACTFADAAGLDAREAFSLIEGLDPLCLVATDEAAAALCAQAARATFPFWLQTRLFGREARAFPRLNALLETEQDRQAVWRSLKTFPRAQQPLQ